MTKKKAPFNLLCVAHPDDETLFFGGLLLQHRPRPWVIVCATDANADGQGRKRRTQFARACRELGVRDFHWVGLPDLFEKRLDQKILQATLAEFSDAHEVYTHGAIGEYGHPHHQDVCFAVHSVFKEHARVFSSAYNAYPEKLLRLSAENFATKARLLTRVYGSETSRFLNLLPANAAEGYVRLKFSEVESLYRYFCGDLKKINARALDHYRWLLPFLEQKRAIARPF